MRRADRFVKISRWATLGAALIVFTLAGAPAQAGWGSWVNKAQGLAGTAAKVGREADKASEEFTPEQEYYLGRAVGAKLVGQYKVIHNEELTGYVNLLGRTLAAASDKPETFGGYHFLVLQTGQINAFACPGGLILVSRGLIGLCRTEDDLAAVLAHEIGHVNYNHGIKAISSSRTAKVGRLLADEAIGRTVGGTAGQLVNLFDDSIGDMFEAMAVNGYSRSQEEEADRASVVILRRLGYDPRGAIRVLAAMKKQFKSDKQGFAKTHPDPDDRIENLEETIGDRACPTPPQVRTDRFRKAAGWLIRP